ncbi:hypothetical protein JCGZ_25555 [Jatropha curcas]|uniref:Uncharacterized protein n=1 Tax=Jatropha curcas TaxID=180498 RepID=A0A067JYN0_JATCU|nr:uncharacterized protein LOC105646555 [Jatropha curcas]KDP24639.1 hypothetical protein JCGZ_25555 [Jatropha curcas]
MRIRKRKTPFPLSALPPVTISDPYFFQEDGKVSNFHPINGQDWYLTASKQENKTIMMEEGEDKKRGRIRRRDGGEEMIAGYWCSEGEKAFPLKKRRESSSGRKLHEENITMDKKMKTKVNKKCIQENENNEEEEGGIDRCGAKKESYRGRGTAAMEVHLGKGRLRSVTSVRNRSMANKGDESLQQLSFSLAEEKTMKKRKYQ